MWFEVTTIQKGADDVEKLEAVRDKVLEHPDKEVGGEDDSVVHAIVPGEHEGQGLLDSVGGGVELDSVEHVDFQIRGLIWWLI